MNFKSKSKAAYYFSLLSFFVFCVYFGCIEQSNKDDFKIEKEALDIKIDSIAKVISKLRLFHRQTICKIGILKSNLNTSDSIRLRIVDERIDSLLNGYYVEYDKALILINEGKELNQKIARFAK